jgi:transposase
MSGLRPFVDDEQLAVLRVLVDRRRSLGEDHTRMVAQLHHLLLQLIPGGAKKDLSAAQAKVLLATVRPRDAAGRARRRVAAELIADMERVYQRKKAANRELEALVRATGTSLLDSTGSGPLVRRGCWSRSVTSPGSRARRTSPHATDQNGTAPIDASSGDQVRHRLSRAGNRQINQVLHIMATVQLRNPTHGREYYDRRKADGKTSMEAMRALKRRLSDIVYRHMLTDAITAGAITTGANPGTGSGTGPGGHPGATTSSSAADSHPNIDTSEKSLPGPANHHPRTRLLAAR